MIRVTIYRAANQRIKAYHVSGHADYDIAGKDIVCAGVSAIVVGTVNAIEKLLDVHLNTHMEKGLLDVAIADNHIVHKADEVQLLLESMLVMLQTIEQSYGEYIMIETIRD